MCPLGNFTLIFDNERQVNRQVTFEYFTFSSFQQTVETDGAVRASSTTVEGGTTLIAIANMGASGRRQTSSRIYRLNDNGSFTVVSVTVHEANLQF